MHENKEFKIYTEILNYSRYIRKYVLSTIPSVHRDLRIHLMDEIYSLERNLVLAENTRGNIRMKHIVEMLTNEKMLDLITSDILEFCPNSKKYMNKSIHYLTNIRNMTYAWKQTLEENEKAKN